MKKLLLYLLLCSPLLAETITGTCKRVVDGDTFILNDGTKVQIWGIDAPEKGQDYASHASGALEKTLKNNFHPVFAGLGTALTVVFGIAPFCLSLLGAFGFLA